MEGHIVDLPPGIRLESIETPTLLILRWTARLDAIMPNRQGNTDLHVTRCTAGRVRFDYLAPVRSEEIGPGQSILLAVGFGYVATALENNTVVECLYPMNRLNALASVAHLRTTIDRLNDPLPFSRRVKPSHRTANEEQE